MKSCACCDWVLPAVEPNSTTEVEVGKKYAPTIAAAIRTERTVIVILFISVAADEVIVSEAARFRVRRCYGEAPCVTPPHQRAAVVALRGVTTMQLPGCTDASVTTSVLPVVSHTRSGHGTPHE